MIDTFWQETLDRYFEEQHLTTDKVQNIIFEAELEDFPRSLTCDCTRCTSPFHEQSVKGRICTIRTDSGETYTAHLPGIPSTYEHPFPSAETRNSEHERT